jgi:hypothetical protein
MAKTKRTIGVNLEAADLEVLRGIAARERRSISFLIRDIVHEFLQRRESPREEVVSDPAVLLHEIPSAIGLDTGTERGDVRLARELLTAAAHLDRLAEQPAELQDPKRMPKRNALGEEIP